MADFSFRRNEKLKSRKRIQALFQSGQTIKSYPLIAQLRQHSSDSIQLQVGFSVSKRHFKRAVDRNRIKRLMREAYRTAALRATIKTELTASTDLMILFVGKQLPDYKTIDHATNRLLQRLQSYV